MTRSRWFVLLLVSGVTLQATMFAVRPAVSYQVLAAGAGTTGVGLVAAAFALVPLVLTVPVGRWVDRAGERPAGLVGAALAVVAAVALIPTTSLAAVVVLNAVLGTGHLLMTISQQTLIANRSSGATRDTAYGRYTVATSLGQLIGPPAATLAAGWAGGDMRFAFACGAVFAVTGLAVAAATRGSDRQVPAPRTGSGHGGAALTRPGMWQVILTSVSTVTAVDLILTFLPVWGADRGVAVTTVGALLAVRAGAGLLSRLTTGPLLRRAGHVRLVVISTVVAGLALAALPWCGTAGAVVVMVISGFALGLGQPLTLAWTAALAPAGRRGALMSVRTAGTRLGQIVVPATAGGLAGLAGGSTTFLLSAVLLVVTAAAAARAPEPLDRS